MGIRLTDDVSFGWDGERYLFTTNRPQYFPGIPYGINRDRPRSGEDVVYVPVVEDDGTVRGVAVRPRKLVPGCSVNDYVRGHLSNESLRDLGEYIKAREPWVLKEPYLLKWAFQINAEVLSGGALHSAASTRKLWPLAAALSLAFSGIMDTKKYGDGFSGDVAPFIGGVVDSNVPILPHDVLGKFTSKELCKELFGVYSSLMVKELACFLNEQGESNLGLVVMFRGMEPDHVCRALRVLSKVNLYGTNIPLEGVPQELPLWWAETPSALRAKLIEKNPTLCFHLFAMDIPGDPVSYKELGVRGSNPIEYHDALLRILLDRGEDYVAETPFICPGGPEVDVDGLRFKRIRRESELVSTGKLLSLCVGSGNYVSQVENESAVMYCGYGKNAVPRAVYHYDSRGLVEARVAGNKAVSKDQAERVTSLLEGFLKTVFPDGDPGNIVFDFGDVFVHGGDPVAA